MVKTVISFYPGAGGSRYSQKTFDSPLDHFYHLYSYTSYEDKKLLLSAHISSTENETIYGCQLTPNISSAVMWKQTIRKPLIDIAYINLYQPFIDEILEVNSK